MFRFKHGSQFVERYHSFVICALNMGDLISNNFCKFGYEEKFLTYFTNQLTDFWAMQFVGVCVCCR
jgi:hypothetical protein